MSFISDSARKTALNQFRERGGILRTQEALRLGIHPRTLYALYDVGLLQRMTRGLYRLADLPPLAAPDWVIVARRLSGAVICLVSALAFHDLTTQIPHTIDVAIKQGSQKPTLAYPPLRVFWFSELAWSEGQETHILDETPVRVFGAAKTVADCFKYRHKIGLDIALEALRFYRERADFQVDRLIHFARIVRVERVLRPHLETLL
jgi:predicted transcriptional regulator of viral defense system